MSKKRKIRQLEAQIASLESALAKRDGPRKKTVAPQPMPKQKPSKKVTKAPKTAVNVYVDSNFIKSLADGNEDRLSRRERRDIAYENRQRRKDVERYRSGKRGGSKIGKAFRILFRVIFVLIIIAIIAAVVGVIVMGLTWVLVNFKVVQETQQIVGLIMRVLRKLYSIVTGGKVLPML